MKAKKIVRVELKNPALRRIRKNFRDIIKLAVKQEVSRLYTISEEYRKRSQEFTDPIEKERLERKDNKFMERVINLKRLLTKSIIQCGMSGGCSSYIEATDHGFYPERAPTNLDMVWMPSYSTWFCTKCYEILVVGDKILREERHPDYMRLLRDSGQLWGYMRYRPLMNFFSKSLIFHRR